MKRKPQVRRTGSFASPRSTSTVQRAVSDDHDARTTRCRNRIFRSMPSSRAVSRR
jgi:hypothetical protein